jgi:NADP-dependent aldehyde dehydrogenase
MLTPGISRTYLQGRNQLAEQEGVTVLAYGQEATGNQAQPALLKTSAEAFINNPLLEEEVFGPMALVVECETQAQMLQLINGLSGHLTSTLHAAGGDQALAQSVSAAISQKVGRVLFNGWPTGVEVAHAMTHGGPYPASTDSRSTSVGSTAIDRWVRPVSWQNAPEAVLPQALQSSNPLQIWRKVDGQITQESL